MAILSYAYLKLKMPGPARIITVEAKAQQALNCEHDIIELATAVVSLTELRELSLQATSLSPHPAMPPSSDAFKSAEDAKAVQINTEDPAKTIKIMVGLNPK
jgi:hypothetical protein